MTTPDMPPTGRGPVATTTALIVVAIVFGVTVVSVLLAFLFAPADRDLRLVIGPLIGTIAPTIAAIALLVQMGSVRGEVAQVRRDTHALTNGLLDSKVRVAVSETVHPNLVNPEVEGLLEVDRKVRDRAHEGTT